jgi:hypothetical protein
MGALAKECFVDEVDVSMRAHGRAVGNGGMGPLPSMRGELE